MMPLLAYFVGIKLAGFCQIDSKKGLADCHAIHITSKYILGKPTSIHPSLNSIATKLQDL